MIYYFCFNVKDKVVCYFISSMKSLRNSNLILVLRDGWRNDRASYLDQEIVSSIPVQLCNDWASCSHPCALSRQSSLLHGVIIAGTYILLNMSCMYFMFL